MGRRSPRVRDTLDSDACPGDGKRHAAVIERPRGPRAGAKPAETASNQNGEFPRRGPDCFAVIVPRSRVLELFRADPKRQAASQISSVGGRFPESDTRAPRGLGERGSGPRGASPQPGEGSQPAKALAVAR